MPFHAVGSPTFSLSQFSKEWPLVFVRTSTSATDDGSVSYFYMRSGAFSYSGERRVFPRPTLGGFLQ